MNRLLKTALSVFLFSQCIFTVFSQETAKKDLEKAIKEADISYNFDKNYAKAASLFEPLLTENPDNENLAAKLGICYLNLEGRKKEALSLLKKAASNIAATEKEYLESGEQAPADTYMYLAKAYHMNDSIEKALNLYYAEKKRLAGSDETKDAYIDLQIGHCRYALEQKKKPLTILPDLFAPWLKDYPGACNPVLSGNDSVFIFTQKTGEKTRILCSYKNGGWQPPHDITDQIGGLDRFYSNSITGNGKLLVLFLDDGGDGNLYFSERKDTTWSRIKNPGKPINTVYWESHGFITPDGNTMFIASNRPGTVGELDIWKSDRLADGKWGEFENCGERINTIYNEDTPFYDEVNGALLFSSDGHMSLGGYDVFRAMWKNGGWTNPVGMPFAFNTTEANTNFILNNNAPGFVASRFDENSGSRNIFAIVAVDPADEITKVEGKMTLEDGLAPDSRKAEIRLTDISRKTPSRQVALNADGTYRFDIKPGDYELLVSHQGYKSETIKLNLPLYFLSRYMVADSRLTPEKVAEGSFFAIKNVLFEFDSYALDDKAKAILESVKAILANHPGLRIEVAGYTDAKGSIDYNLKLADKRAQAVIDYLASSSVPSTKFVKKAFGESNFAAINTNSDGSDSPEGRRYNRRVTFGLIDPLNNIVIRQNAYTPEHLRLASSTRYSIILKKTSEKLYPDSFKALNLNGLQLINAIPAGTSTIYSVGVFYNKSDAEKYLSAARDKGFADAYIVTQYELDDIARK